MVVRGTPVTNLDSFNSTSGSGRPSSSFRFLEADRRSRLSSKTGSVIFLTWNSLLRTSSVLSSVKPSAFS